MIINNVIAIAQKELRNYFVSPFAYSIAAVFWFFSGFFLVEILLGQQGIIQQLAFQEQAGIDIGNVDVATEFLNSYLAILGTLSLLIIPVLSMGLYTEERKLGTIELLATSPLSNWVVALGKLIAVSLFFIFLLIPSLLIEIIVFCAAQPAMPALLPLVAHLGLVMVAVAMLSIGMFISSLTSSNILAAILTFSAIFFLWIIDSVASSINKSIGEIIGYFSLLESYNNLVLGIVNVGDITLFISYVFLGLFLTAQSVEYYRLNRR